MKAAIIVAIVVLLAAWEYDEIRMLYLLKKNGGEFTPLMGSSFLVEFPDCSAIYVHRHKGLWMYEALDDPDDDAYKVVDQIRRGSIANKIFGSK